MPVNHTSRRNLRDEKPWDNTAGKEPSMLAPFAESTAKPRQSIHRGPDGNPEVVQGALVEPRDPPNKAGSRQQLSAFSRTQRPGGRTTGTNWYQLQYFKHKKRGGYEVRGDKGVDAKSLQRYEKDVAGSGGA